MLWLSVGGCCWLEAQEWFDAEKVLVGVSWEGQPPRDMRAYAGSFGADVTLPVNADGLFLLRYAQSNDHRFAVSPKMLQELDSPKSMHCPMCDHFGKIRGVHPPETWNRLGAAGRAMVEQYVHEKLDRMLTYAFRSSQSITIRPGLLPPVCTLPSYSRNQPGAQ
jgi:hypothetical protein